MRFTLRLLALSVLLAFAGFSSLVGPVKADKCTDDCLTELQNCSTACHGNSDCIIACVLADKACVKACKPEVD